MHSLKALADLARAGAGVGSGSRPEVQLRVQHLKDRPGMYRQALEQRLTNQPERKFVETVTSAACGVGLIIESYVDRNVGPSRATFGGDPQLYVEPDQDPEQKVFRGLAQPNPTFLYEGSTVIEALVAIDPDNDGRQPLRRHHGATLYRVATEVADLAADEAGSPILSLQAPVFVPPTRTTVGTPEWGVAHAPAVRFSIAIGASSSEERIRYFRRLETFCRGRGLGLWIADYRPEHRAGNWYPVLEHDNDLAIKTGRDSARVDPDGELHWVLPLTLVGPARVGSTLETLRLLGRDTGVPSLVAFSGTVIDDLAFINLQFGLTDAQYSEGQKHPMRPATPVVGAKGWQEPPLRLTDLRELLGAFGIGWDSASIQRVLADYVPLHGPIVDVRNPPPPGRGLWFAWEVESRTAGLGPALLALYKAIDRVIEPSVETGTIDKKLVEQHDPSIYPNLEYLISRDKGSGVVRARGKLSVPDDLIAALPVRRGATDVPPTIEWSDRATALAVALEDCWHGTFQEKGLFPRQLTVAWREWWLRG